MTCQFLKGIRAPSNLRFPVKNMLTITTKRCSTTGHADCENGHVNVMTKDCTVVSILRINHDHNYCLSRYMKHRFFQHRTGLVCMYMCNCIVLCTYVYMCTIHTASHETFYIMTMAALLLPHVTPTAHHPLPTHPPSPNLTYHLVQLCPRKQSILFQ